MLKKGFTLAEVLITLTIIGVIAAITMPAVMTNVNDNVLEAQAKKFYSQLTAALDLYRARHEIDTLASGLETDELAETIMNTTTAATSDDDAGNDLVDSYMNIQRAVPRAKENIFGAIGEDNPLYKLKDGSVFTIRDGNNNNWIVAADVNGRRGPNRYGEDVWTMVIGTDGKISINAAGMGTGNCLNGDNRGSCMALFARSNFRFRNYRDSIANEVEIAPLSGGSGLGGLSGVNSTDTLRQTETVSQPNGGLTTIRQ